MNEETIGEWTKIEDLNPWKDNPRINQSAIDEVAKSIKRFGFASPIIARSEDKMIIAGHTRFEAAKKLGLQKVPVRLMNLDIGEAQLLALADNKIGEIADWDEEKLKAILSDLKDEDLAGLGWSDEELSDLIDYEPGSELHGDPDEVPEVQEDAITQEGDLWILGNHRLLCGDSTKEENVAVLMNGEKADMVFTDPPYGMDLDTDYSKMINKNGQAGKKHKKIVGDEKQFNPKSIFIFFKEVEEIIMFGADYFCDLIPNRKDGSWLVWDKRVEEKYDKIFGSSFELIWSRKKRKREILRHEYCSWGSRMEGKTEQGKPHPTMKPTKLLVDIILKTKSSKIVDLFGGSGSTLIACEQTNRKCFMMELDPHYCDVIVRRWQLLTGKVAVNQNGQSFNDISDLPW
tara:strand:- start:47 stop:1252 length:1206 start_codon:yes stop_codon:yes gene_type:complete